MCIFFCSRSPMSSSVRFRLCGESSAMPPSWPRSLTLCAGVGRVDVTEVMDVLTLESGSVLFGDDCEGLCGVCGWKDMVEISSSEE